MLKLRRLLVNTCVALGGALFVVAEAAARGRP